MTPVAFAARAADLFAHPLAIVALPVVSALAVAMLGPDEVTFVLSVAALTISQLILLSQAADTRAVQRKLDALVVAVPDAPDDLAGCEKE